MKVSVIIPTYNEKEHLGNAIESLGSQTLDDFEIIVVDDGSTDGTLDILQNLVEIIPRFSFYKQNHKGPGAARNFGSKSAKGEILVFVDADMTFDKNFLDNLVRPIKEMKASGTWSPEEYVSNWDNVWARCWNINEGWKEKKRNAGDFNDHHNVFRAILKKEFDKVGGFTPGGYNDDWTLSEKLGHGALTTPKAIFYHSNPSSLVEVFNHARWVGKRRYKLGLLGYLISLLRSSLPISLLIAIFKAIYYKEASFILFKVVYDFGVFIGILNFAATGQGAK